ncbi:hypothetical protein AM501_05335 [Aneurinibacillus migulanus]|uniref:PrgI family protein n=1 Tax=Aneurinibacillus migulanus TaxID=47500 RepID=UPI0005BDE53A|nr:PrgI family protein [Aneurinibacillus migulanus]KIV58570.1 hypothetical protein TS64_04280 [Aneurinibacillus migulanus]KPD09258.1 hypothetical protein AM501_05335 [Aneurinibacillus migulanus]
MNEIVVPIDITGEEKDILAIFSKRQFMLIFPTVVASLIFLFWGNIPFIGPLLDVIIRALVFIVAVASAICLAYIKLDRYEQYLSEYVVTQFKFRRSQKTFF